MGILLAAVATPALPQTAPVPLGPPVISRADVGRAIAEASLRFGVPEPWIRAVIRAESFGDVHAVSSKGAIGLMQLMPATYAAVRLQLGLGPNPFDIHDNITAGAAYMRLLFDRYGLDGMIGAYNAGPARWEAHLAGARPLPAETVSYVARVSPLLGIDAPAVLSNARVSAPRSPLEAPLFVSTRTTTIATGSSPDRRRVLAVIDANPTVVPPSDGGLSAADQQDNKASMGASTVKTASAATATDTHRSAPKVPSETLFVPATERAPEP